MENVLSIVNEETGIKFNVRVVRFGERYGLGNRLIFDRENDCLVEFYDSRFLHTTYGQFVQSYYKSTLEELDGERGLCLYGGEKDWYITANNVKEVKEWLQQF
jgi:hypothetical protein